MSLAHEVAETKAQSDDKIYKPDREAEIIEQRSAGMEEEVRLKYIALLQSMIRASRGRLGRGARLRYLCARPYRHRTDARGGAQLHA